MTEQDYKEKRAAVQQSGMPLDIQKYFERLLDKDFNADKLIEAWRLFIEEGDGAVDKKGIRDVSNIQKKSGEIK